MNEYEKAYKMGDVAKMIGIAVPTVRKYVRMLENKGYVFTMEQGEGKNKARLFVQDDIMAIRFLKETREQAGVTVEMAANIVIERFGKGALQTITTDVTEGITPYKEPYDALQKALQLQQDTIKQQTHIIKAMQDELSEIKAMNREMINILDQPKEEKKGFFKRLFNK